MQASHDQDVLIQNFLGHFSVNKETTKEGVKAIRIQDIRQFYFMLCTTVVNRQMFARVGFKFRNSNYREDKFKSKQITIKR